MAVPQTRSFARSIRSLFGEPLTGPLSLAQRKALRQATVRVEAIGWTAEGQELVGLRCGDPALPLVSIVAGAHPDEPAGPLAALQLVANWHRHPLRDAVQLAVVPQLDIDGARDQAGWLSPWTDRAELHRYLAHRLRRQPGADREFAWPGAPWGGTVLPECQAAADFFAGAGAAIGHLSLHGMATAAGVWFLVDAIGLADGPLWNDLRACAAGLGLALHDAHRYGDKGFRRCGTGMATTPSGPAMRRHFLAAGDPATAAGFGYGSMDHARLLCRQRGLPPPVCAVSEFPLWRLPTELAYDRAALEAACTAIVSADDPSRAAADFLARPGVAALPLATQVTGMRRMVAAVIRASLRRHEVAAWRPVLAV